MKKPVFKLDRAGLFIEALGLSLHIHRDTRTAGEPFAWASAPSPLGRRFRLGGLAGASPASEDRAGVAAARN